ncbi:hypothetical protein [Variovorax sp.]|uniref:hypothetical protein n=1 Tax=Variovorax sp. TaxID=1871043 RepID=UPI002D41E87D|nr:hypothetical protein [Variovorax sp.]HYP84120.1 hypothetical protein [Variovorax sp.]
MAAEQDKEVIPRSRLNAEQVLRKLLELIRSSQIVSDITPQRLEALEGGEVKHFESGGYGIQARLTPQLTYVFEMWKTTRGFLLRFRFGHRRGVSPPMTGICQLDFAAFVAELEALGYDHQPIYDQPPVPIVPRPLPNGEMYWPSPLPNHGRLLAERFYRADGRPGLSIDVAPRVASRAYPGRLCVTSVRVVDGKSRPGGRHG